MSKEPNYQLKENCIDIWLCQAEKMEKKVDYFFSILSLQEKKRAERFKFDIHRKRFIISHGFKRSILSEYLKVNPLDIEFIKGDKGKPYLLNSVKSLQFNLSHTEDITILGITKDAEIGIDIEHINRKTDWESICQRFFTQSEQAVLFALEKQQQKLSFYQLWTRKEAYMKYLFNSR